MDMSWLDLDMTSSDSDSSNKNYSGLFAAVCSECFRRIAFGYFARHIVGYSCFVAVVDHRHCSLSGFDTDCYTVWLDDNQLFCCCCCCHQLFYSVSFIRDQIKVPRAHVFPGGHMHLNPSLVSKQTVLDGQAAVEQSFLPRMLARSPPLQ